MVLIQFNIYTIQYNGYTSSDYPISGPSTTCPNSSVYFSAPTLAGAISYNWFWPSGWNYYNGQGTPNLALGAGSFSGVVGLRVTSVCDPAGGTPATKFVQVLNCGGGGWGYRVAPNPGKGNITIAVLQATENKIDKIYTIKIIDQYGNTRKQYNYATGISSININLSNLPNGVYTISAFNGNSWVSELYIKQ